MRRYKYQTKGSDKDFTNRLIYVDKQKLSEYYNNLKTEVKAFPRKETLNKAKNKFMDVVNEGPSAFYRYGGAAHRYMSY